VNAKSLERLGPVQTRLSDVKITTCDETDDPEFFISSGTVDVYDDTIFVMRNPVFYLHGIPFFYLYRMTYDQERQPTNIDVVPGYGSRDGFSLLNSYTRYPRDGYQTKTHVDYRSKRGFGAGQDWFWYDPENLTANQTLVRVYGALDNAPYRNDEQEEEFRARGIDIDEERYRIRVQHRQQFTPQDTLWANVSYLSDARVVEDFFREEFRNEPVPESRAVYSSVGDGWNASLELSRQLNEDEFSAVNRMPEAVFNVPLRQLEGFDVLYQSTTRAGWLERNFSRFERDEGNEVYDTLRIDTNHMLFYPTRHFGWLNVIPRAGGRLTYYGDTRETRTRSVPTTETDEDGVITTTFETVTEEMDAGADTRILPEIGFETSFKAFGLIHDNPTRMGRGVRHVVEPFTNYTFIPKPGLRPENIPQFDRIDTLDERHDISFGVRNKWQTRRRHGDGRVHIHDLVNLAVSTNYDLRSDADPNLGNIFVDTELRLVNWASVRFDFTFDTDETDVTRANAELRFQNPETRSFVTVDQRFRQDERHTLQFTYRLNTEGRLGIEGYTRYELENDGFEEQELLFTWETDCVGYGVGGRWIKGDEFTQGGRDQDDFEVWLQIWLTAFPRAIVGTGGR